MRLFIAAATFVVLLEFGTSLAFGQPSRERGRDDRGRDDRRRDDRGRGGDRDDWVNRVDPSEMLRRADKNGDGKVEPNEIDERFRGFTNRLIEKYGMDPGKTVVLDTIKKKYEKMRDGEKPKKKEDASITFGIPSFNDLEDDSPAMVPDFYLSADSALLQTGSLESRYEKSIISQIDRTLSMNDKNRDGVIDANEIRAGRWERPASDSDLNKDGKLTRVELAERYVRNAGGKGRIEKGKKSSSSPSKTASTRSSSSRDNSRSRSQSRSKTSSSTSSSKSRSSTSKKSSGSPNDKIASYAKTIITKYDKNKNGILDSDEAKIIRSLPRNADKDKNGDVSLDELIVAFGGKPGGSSSRSSSYGSKSRSKSNSNNKYLITSGAERSDAAGREFQQLDANRDGLVQMNEFAKKWTRELANNFADMDSDNDGQLTVDEWGKGGKRSSRSDSRSSESRSGSTKRGSTKRGSTKRGSTKSSGRN